MISQSEQRVVRQPGFRFVPRFSVPLHVWQQLMSFVNMCPDEINGFGYIDVTPGGDFLLSQVFILEQRVTAASVDVDALTLARHQTAMLQAGEDPGRMRFQWHSHVNFGAYFSGTDLNNIDSYGSDWMISLVANKRGEYELRLDVFRPFPVWTPLELDLIIPGAQHFDAHSADEIRQKVRRGVLNRSGKPAKTPTPGTAVTLDRYPVLGNVIDD